MRIRVRDGAKESSPGEPLGREGIELHGKFAGQICTSLEGRGCQRVSLSVPEVFRTVDFIAALGLNSH
jgi:hypothetical protein